MSGTMFSTGATTGEYIYADLPTSPVGFIPITLPAFASGTSGAFVGPTGYLIPFYNRITGV